MQVRYEKMSIYRILNKINGFKPSHVSTDTIQKIMGLRLQNYMNKLHRSYDPKLVEELVNIPTWRDYKELLKV